MSNPSLSPIYEVFAIRVGANSQRTARENFLYDACCGDPNAPMPLDYYFWVIRNDRHVVVVDTCFQPATADRRNREMYRLPEESLQRLGIDPAEVETLILTHLHWDHAGNLGLFPKATIHLQEEELRFCTGPKMTHRAISKTYEVDDVMSAIPPLFEGRPGCDDPCGGRAYAGQPGGPGADSAWLGRTGLGFGAPVGQYPSAQPVPDSR